MKNEIQARHLGKQLCVGQRKQIAKLIFYVSFPMFQMYVCIQDQQKSFRHQKASAQQVATTTKWRKYRQTPLTPWSFD